MYWFGSKERKKLTTAAKLVDPAERRYVFDSFLRCIDREESLIHYRLTWGLQWNAAVIGALFFIYNVELSFTWLGLNSDQFVKVVGTLLCIFGMFGSAMSSIGVLAAHEQTASLIRNLEAKLGVASDWTEEGEFIRPYDDNKVHGSARIVSRYFPLIFVFIWFAVLLAIISNTFSLDIKIL